MNLRKLALSAGALSLAACSHEDATLKAAASGPSYPYAIEGSQGVYTSVYTSRNPEEIDMRREDEFRAAITCVRIESSGFVIAYAKDSNPYYCKSAITSVLPSQETQALDDGQRAWAAQAILASLDERLDADRQSF